MAVNLEDAASDSVGSPKQRLGPSYLGNQHPKSVKGEDPFSLKNCPCLPGPAGPPIASRSTSEPREGRETVPLCAREQDQVTRAAWPARPELCSCANDLAAVFRTTQRA